jgi:hypothetical protein
MWNYSGYQANFICVFIYCFTPCSRIFHLYGDVASDRLEILRLRLALRALEQRGIFIVLGIPLQFARWTRNLCPA